MTTKAPWWDRLNAALLPKIGPPPLGPYNEPPLPPTGAKPCPVCGLPMSEHRIERGITGDARTATRIHCPTADEHRAFVLDDALAMASATEPAATEPAAAHPAAHTSSKG